jgi:DNA repair exonuclease SbcCD ATPase subunit
MIIFKNIKWKNFLSTGDNEVEINLNANKSTLIVGHNGAGKSTLLDALSFALFGKPHRSVNKKGLINSVNRKNCLTTVEFTAASHEFKIVRGIKPNIFEIWQDGVMVDQSANARDYQKFLEQNILKLNHKSFHQIVVLGSSSFIPFMQLKPKHRREVIEDLLDISIFSSMKGILKERTSIIKSKLKDTRSLLDIDRGKLEYQDKYITQMEGLNRQAEEDVEANNAKIDTEISGHIQYGINLTNSLIDDPTSKLLGLNATASNLIGELAGIKGSIEQCTEEHLFYMNNDSCPTCSQTITQGLKDDRVSTLKSGAKALFTTRETAITAQVINNEDIAEITKELEYIASINTKMRETQTKIEQLKASKQKPVQATDLGDDYAELKALKTSTGEYQELFDEYYDKLLYADSAKEMLKDTGIRTKVVREYLPAMNLLINQYLQTLDFFVHFQLDENFDETIRSRHRDTFVYANFSEGEKMRIDLALLFAWRQIAKMKNSTNTNLLILDETFDSSLDNDGVDNLMKILFSLDKNTNTFIISHKPDLLESRLDHKLEFKKTNNFSKII